METKLNHAVRMAEIALEDAENHSQAQIADYSNTKMVIMSVTDVRALLEYSQLSISAIKETAEALNTTPKIYFRSA